MSQPSTSDQPPRYLLLAMVIALAMPMRAAIAQSFDCRAARSPDEMTICQDPRLAELDQKLAGAYHNNLGKLDPEQREAFQRHKVYFLNARRRCGFNRQCLAQSYLNRIHELEGLMAQDRDRDEEDAAPPVRSTAAADQPSEQRSDRRRSGVSPPRPPSDAAIASRGANHAAGNGSGTSNPEPRPEAAVSGGPEPATRPAPSPAAAAPTKVAPRATPEPVTKPVAAAMPDKQELAEPHPAKPKPSGHHRHSRKNDTETAAGGGGETAASGSTAGSGGAPAKPKIEWANPPPER